MNNYLPGAVFMVLGSIWMLDYQIRHAPIYILIAVMYWAIGAATMFMDRKGPPPTRSA